MSNNKGYSIVELIVTMVIFMIVIMITSYAFEKTVGKASLRSKSVEGEIEGIVGLELMRTDLAGAGFGLPWTFGNLSSAIKYDEADSSSPVTSIVRNSYNDAPANVPRAVVSSNNNSFNNSDYLVIKSSSVAMNDTAQKSSYISYKENAATHSPEGILRKLSSDKDFITGERAIVIRSKFPKGDPEGRELVLSSAGDFYLQVPSGVFPSSFSPKDSTDTYLIYGIDPDTNLRMPFNRADYFINRPSDPKKIPLSCNAGTGILYKATCNQSDGGDVLLPLVDCVGDMQIVYLFDMNEDGTGETYSNADGGTISSSDASVTTATVKATMASSQLLRQRLKEIKIYVLGQIGRKDKDYQHPDDDIVVGDPLMPSLGRTWTKSDMAATFGSDWRTYRWKIYTIAAKTTGM